MQAQTRNWILFFLSFVIIIVGFPWVRNKLWPPAWQPSREDRIAAEHVARMLTAVTGTGIGDIAEVGTQAAVTYGPAKDYALAVAQEKAEKDKQAAAKLAEKAKPAKPAVPAKPAELISLGGDNYYLKVDLTNRGAGVHDLTLTPFKGANALGLPEKDAQGHPLDLRLIPPSDETSFALYHYATADPGEKQPLDTLGVRDWQVVEKSLNDEEQRVVFATELPEFGVRLVKTFILRPREYHLGLSVRIERLANAKDARPFRYQLAGGHGLPIEGEWYTTIFRNAFFDWVDANGADKRNQFDSRSIALTSGTDRIQRTGPRLQYAAVAIQYFTSAIVVSEDQPKRDFIEFVRATVEGEPDSTKQQLDDITVRAIAEAVDPKPGEAVEHKYLLYHGPV
ncbi:MAG TPA: YidC/Oxa1 family insertase periplasmic-domain containing protein, partial [Gemmataceae bacterium]|nr:YidC/Oxa1 family insertase periplasmic-domain containing protein [Gemmataceae bacterium]